MVPGVAGPDPVPLARTAIAPDAPLPIPTVVVRLNTPVASRRLPNSISVAVRPFVGPDWFPASWFPMMVLCPAEPPPVWSTATPYRCVTPATLAMVHPTMMLLRQDRE